jgi:hypothetical protein
MKDAAVIAVTTTSTRKYLYHFTRVKNLPAIAHLDALYSSYTINPNLAGQRRTEPKEVGYHNYLVTINAHLKIIDSMIDPSTTQEQFRACLDRHVFFWPTLKDCRKMMETYARREPDEGFAVLEFDAYSLLLDHFSAVKISKYDSGSSPRFPAKCSYKKSPAMWLPLNRFRTVVNNTVPTKVSEIREILVENQVTRVSQYLRAVYTDSFEAVPECWGALVKPQDILKE